MKTIEQEAEKYANIAIIKREYIPKTDLIAEKNALKTGFIAGHNSKATQAKILQAQIDVLTEIGNSNKENLFGAIKLKRIELQQQLKELE